MNLTGLEEITDKLLHTRGGIEVEAFPRVDCVIEEGADELEQLREVAGAYYFYGQLLGNIEKALRAEKINLKKVSASSYLSNHKTLQDTKARITEVVLANLVNVDLRVLESSTKIAELEGNKIKVDTILTALQLKDKDLNEISRRSYLQEKSIGRLTS